MLKNNKKKGFSLIELVAVIAIMAIVAMLLVPGLMRHTEESRAGKDVTSMDEVTNAVLLSVSDQKGYDEMVQYSLTDNVSCYIDKTTENGYTKIITREQVGNVLAQYSFDDDCRRMDETPYTLAGNMRGVTITFEPDHTNANATYNLKDAVINKFVGPNNNVKLENCEYVYSSLKAAMGETIVLDSNTYKNSEFTIFIRLGTTGGNDADKQDAVKVYGQYSGTNLMAEDITYSTAIDRNSNVENNNGNQDNGGNDGNGNGGINNGGTPDYDSGDLNNGGSLGNGGEVEREVIPEGGIYKTGFTKTEEGWNYGDMWIEDAGVITLTAGDYFPEKPSAGDWYSYGEYEYGYGSYCDCLDGWCKSYIEDGGWAVRYVGSSTTAPEMLREIVGKPITNLQEAFYGTSVRVAPTIPETVTNMFGCFENSNIRDVSKIVIPRGCTSTAYLFTRCSSLIDASTMTMGDHVTDASSMFMYCSNLKKAPRMSSGLTDIITCFSNCTSLTSVDLSNCTKLEYVQSAFEKCTSLKTAPKFVSGWNFSGTFRDCTALVESPELPASAVHLYSMFYGCTSLQKAPILHGEVECVNYMFGKCTSLRSVTVHTNKINKTEIGGIFTQDQAGGCAGMFDKTTQKIYLIGTANKSVKNLMATQCSNSNVIVPASYFYIDGKIYQSDEGMTLSAWVNSSYNTDGYKLSGQTVWNSTSTKYLNKSASVTISQGTTFTLK